MNNKFLKIFQEETSADFKNIPKIDYKEWPVEWKTIYFKKYSRLPKINFPKNKKINFSLEKALQNRKSVRDFKKESISLSALGTILFYAGGIVEKQNNDWNKSRRFYPSGGARFPLEIYPIVLKEDKDIGEGIYHYNIKENNLDVLFTKKEIIKEIYPWIIDQDMIINASVLLIVSAVFQRNMTKYQNRGIRYVFLEAGHLGQNVYLLSTALGLKCCAIGGFDDNGLNGLLDFNKEESAIYAFALGR